ncbi:MAG: O-antigen ligase family protein, partial [Planctomycetia bacterium]|nr:O-antigen ligase family protein [Planctomycetia bacterium]
MPSRLQADRWLGIAQEALLLLLVVLSPWPFGSVEPIFEAYLYYGLALLALLWGARCLLQGRFVWKKSSVVLCVAGLFLLGIWQLQPLPRSVLALLSPQAAALYDEMLPARPELLPTGEEHVRPPLPAGQSLSLYPEATRRNLIRLLAIVILYALVRNQVASPGSLKRLCFILVVNGCALALFAIFQFITCPRDTVYWTFKTKGAVFGPFVSRTHYPFYLNICIGAGIGLLLALQDGTTRTRRRRRQAAPEFDGGEPGLLQDPARLWLSLALALMVGSVLLSLARGGFLALLGGAVALFFVRRWVTPRARSEDAERAPTLRFSRIGVVLIVLAAALALTAWIAGDVVEARLATIWTGQALEQSRWPLWRDSLPLVREYPLLGSGYGTFAYMEPLHRAHTPSIFIHEHAHNEYLEALIEGGVLRLGISLLAIGLIYYHGLRAARREAGKPAGGLALGALFGFTTFVLHSIGDFGVHLPAIALLVTVLVAHLEALGRDDPEQQPTDGSDPPDTHVFRWYWVAPVLAALLLALVARIFWVEGRRMERVQVYRILAARLQGDRDPEDRARQLELLQAAARLAPNSAGVLSELGRVHLERFEQRQAELTRARRAADAAAQVLAGAPWPAPLPRGGVVPHSRIGAAAWTAAAADENRQLVREHLVPALQAYLQARDACPLMAKPHIRLAANAQYLRQADTRTVYLDRAKRVVTNDAELYFLFGTQELISGQRDRAVQSWRRSLELGDQYLPAMLQLGRETLGVSRLVNEVLPDQPELL